MFRSSEKEGQLVVLPVRRKGQPEIVPTPEIARFIPTGGSPRRVLSLDFVLAGRDRLAREVQLRTVDDNHTWDKVAIIGVGGRCFSSAFCGALQGCGLDFGPEEELFPADKFNPKGYFSKQIFTDFQLFWRWKFGNNTKPLALYDTLNYIPEVPGYLTLFRKILDRSVAIKSDWTMPNPRVGGSQMGHADHISAPHRADRQSQQNGTHDAAWR